MKISDGGYLKYKDSNLIIQTIGITIIKFDSLYILSRHYSKIIVVFIEA